MEKRPFVIIGITRGADTHHGHDNRGNAIVAPSFRHNTLGGYPTKKEALTVAAERFASGGYSTVKVYKGGKVIKELSK
jgi:hypothetical protein